MNEFSLPNSGEETVTDALEPPTEQGTGLISRRMALRAIGSMATLAAGLTGYATAIEPRWTVVRNVDMHIRGLPTSLGGKTVLQMSDLHIGLVDTRYLIGCLQKAALLKPDLVALTGDVTHDGATHDEEVISRVLKHLPRAPLGTFAVLGNHDYGPSWNDELIADQVTTRLTEAGARVLSNEVVDVGGLQIGGIDDFWSPRYDAVGALSKMNMDKGAITLCHNPDVCDINIWEGYRGWILSGHTHGGQCRIPFMKPLRLPVKNKRYTSGQFDLSGERTLYINPGLGYLIPVRFGVRPEFTVFTLRPA